MTDSAQDATRVCRCGTEFEPPEEYIDICYDCRVEEIRKNRREGPDL